jgi:DNA repair exonuclease SbcCD ATPase subunit
LDMEENMELGEALGASHSEDAIHSDMAGSLFELTPHPKNYMVKFLCDANGVQLPILGEYFGVALAFAALGALIRGNKVAPSMKLTPELQRVGLQVMLKNAMDRLQLLALNAHDLEQKVEDGKEAWEEERRLLAQKLSVAEAQVATGHKRRQEDAKANEKVVGIFASYEQTWKNEKKKLKREVELLRNEIISMRKRTLGTSGQGSCEECKSKLQELEKLEDKLCEKEFLMAAAMDEAKSDQHERNHLAGKLAMVELHVLDLKDRLSKETARSAELQATVADVRKKHEETERKAMSELERARTEKMNQSAMVEELLEELTNVQKDVGEKEEVIAVMMKRSNVDRQEREEMLHQLAVTKAKRKAAETEKDRWKRLAEERARNVPAGRDGQKARRSLGSRVEMDKLSEIQRSHNEEVHDLRAMYVTKLESLQGQLNAYEQKVAFLESRIERQKRQPKQEDHVNCHELVTLLESIVPDVDVMQQLDGLSSEIQGGWHEFSCSLDFFFSWGQFM